MAGVNKVILVGNLGGDPEVRYTPQGNAVANFSVATNEVWTDNQGERQQRTEWHRVVVWNRLAEICSEYLRKGSLVYVEGRLRTREWEDRDGNRRWTTEIIANSMQMLDRRNGTEREGEPPKEESKGPESEGLVSKGPESKEPEAVTPDDEIPF